MKLKRFFKSKTVRVHLIVVSIFLLSGLLIQPLIISIIFPKEELYIDSANLESSLKKLTSEIDALDKKLSAKIPRSPYLIINSSDNRFSLKKGLSTIKEDRCSTGSYILLKNGDNQQWMFKTPKGEFKILSKTKNPVWKKPDWAFVEEGLPVPSINHSSRFEYGVLGDYSLGIGNGYLIHGTIYQRFIGLPVTHGCVRLNDENLELVYQTLPMGAKVYIF